MHIIRIKSNFLAQIKNNLSGRTPYCTIRMDVGRPWPLPCSSQRRTGSAPNGLRTERVSNGSDSTRTSPPRSAPCCGTAPRLHAGIADRSRCFRLLRMSKGDECGWRSPHNSKLRFGNGAALDKEFSHRNRGISQTGKETSDRDSGG